MRKTFAVIASVVLGLNFALVPRASAGTDMVIDNSAQAPPPVYRYAPPPPVYYAPPIPVRVAVYPTYGYYARPVRVFGYQRFHAHRGSWHHGHGH